MLLIRIMLSIRIRSIIEMFYTFPFKNYIQVPTYIPLNQLLMGQTVTHQHLERKNNK